MPVAAERRVRMAAVFHRGSLMPVTARLSRKFYDRLGDDIANELVDWFNSVDATYRQDLRELNELNFARFDAKVEQRFAESDARFERRFSEFETKWERRFTDFESNWERQFAEFESKWERQFGTLRVELATRETRLLRWMFAFWTTNLLATAGLVFAVMRTR